MANVNANDFVISAKVIPDTSEITSEFKRISKTTTFNVNAKLDDQSFKNVTKVVETFSDGLGTAKQKITLLNDANEELATSVTKVSSKFKPFADNVKKADDNLDKTSTSAKSASQSLDKTNTSVKNVGNSSQTASTQTNKLGQSFGDIVTKVSKFYLATVPINMFKDALRETIDIVKEFDDTLTEFKKVSDLSGESLTDYTKKLGELGQEVGRTRTEMVSSASEFVRSGYSEEDAAQLAKIAELYRNIADEAITSGESASFIISQMKAFSNNTEEFAQHTIDAINNVSNNMSVSSSDISTALSKTSSAMGALGNSFEETIALVTAGTEIMHGQASKVARG